MPALTEERDRISFSEPENLHDVSPRVETLLPLTIYTSNLAVPYFSLETALGLELPADLRNLRAY